MQDRCSMGTCVETAIASLEDRSLCYQHFLERSYERLESISVQIHEPQFHQRHAEATGRFLEDAMRSAADIACAVESPSNLDRARVLDVLLWASELHGLLRRGSRLPAKIPVLLRSQALGKSWEEQAETELVSRHGAQIVCRHEVKTGDTLTCVRTDTGAQVESRVVWTRRRASGEMEAGIEFLSDVNYWNLENGGAVPPVTSERP